MHGGQPFLLATAGGAGRLAVDTGDFVARVDQRAKRRDREIGCAHIGQAQAGRHGGYSAALDRFSFLVLVSFRRIMLRFSAEM